MKIAKRAGALVCAAALTLGLCACGAADMTAETKKTAASDTRLPQRADLKELALGAASWQYDAANDVYWLSGLAYCANPRDEERETLSLFVPGKYLKGKKNMDGTYACSLNFSPKINGYTAATAPVVLAVDPPAYRAKTAPAAYQDGAMGRFLKAGMVYAAPGIRGAGGENPGSAPWGAVDLKAAVRFLRLNWKRLPGDMNQIFACGTGAGGALTAVLGASGDSADYLPYLDSIGAALYDEEGNSLSDAVNGAMCWNPAAPPDSGDSAYEWLLGQYAEDGDRESGVWTSALSRDLAAAYAAQVNAMKLTDGEGTRLTLEPTQNGIYTAGGYADAVKSTLEDALNHWLNRTKFPMTATVNGKSTVCKTAQAYVDALNGGGHWISFDGKAARISDLSGFARHCAGTLKGVAARDGLERQNPENQAFAVSGEKALHFDAALSVLLAEHQREYAARSGWKSAYPTAYAGDLQKSDELGRDAAARCRLYEPLRSLHSGGITPAKFWRINCGVTENGAAILDGLSLSLALCRNAAVKKVKFMPVWAQKNALPEETGSGAEQFLRWIEQCCPAEE